MKSRIPEQIRTMAMRRKAFADEAKHRQEDEEYHARFTPEYFAASGQRIIEIADQMDRALAEVQDLPHGYERKAPLWSCWNTLRDYVSELTYGIELLPNIEETGFRYWNITDVALAAEHAIKEENDEKFRAAIAEAKQIGQAIATAMQGVSLKQLSPHEEK